MRGFFASIAVISMIACAAPPAPPMEVAIHVKSDPGRPLKGAQILYGGQKVATTGDDGVAKISLRGSEGDAFDVSVSCPQGFRSPAQPLSVTLRRLADPSKVPQYDVACPPTTRAVVVAVRAEKGPNLPVMYLGREVARTDPLGAAHVLLEVHPDEPFDLMVATTEKGNEGLRPQNPVATFTVKNQDDLFVFEPRFSVETKKAAVHAPVFTGPIRLPPIHRRP